MYWKSEGIVIAIRPFGENDALVEIFTRDHGRHAGLVKGGKAQKKRPLLQIGNHLDITWQARLSDQLGQFILEPIRLYAARIMHNATKIAKLTTLAALTAWLPERENQITLYDEFLLILKCLIHEQDHNQQKSSALLAKWELQFLAALGYGLDFSKCAATGRKEKLIYVSPKSGCAVSAQAGRPYHDKLFPLPQFLLEDMSHIGQNQIVPEKKDILNAFMMNRFFLEKRLPQENPHHIRYLAKHKLPTSRNTLIDMIKRHEGSQ